MALMAGAAGHLFTRSLAMRAPRSFSLLPSIPLGRWAIVYLICFVVMASGCFPVSSVTHVAINLLHV